MGPEEQTPLDRSRPPAPGRSSWRPGQTKGERWGYVARQAHQVGGALPITRTDSPGLTVAM